MNKNVYSISPDAYLGRAFDHIQDGNAASLFYAALELRFFVESRQDQYLYAQAEYVNSIPKRWKIGAQGKTLEAVFESNRIQRVSWSTEGEMIFEAHYVPLHPDLRKFAEKAGDLLHARSEWIAPHDPWWEKTWRELRKAYELEWQCNCGSLLSPMLLVNGSTVGRVLLPVNDDNEHELLLAAFKEGTQGTMKVDYLSSPHLEWKSNLESHVTDIS